MNSKYNGYQISDDIQRINYEKVTEWLAGCYWSSGIKREEVERAAKYSSLVISHWGLHRGRATGRLCPAGLG